MNKIFFKSFIFLLLLFLLSYGLFCFKASALAKEIEPWTNLNLYGGQIIDIAIDPCNPLKMFAGSFLGDGLFITQDGGNNWQAVLTGHESSRIETGKVFRNTIVWAIKIAPPPNNNVIWVAHDQWAKKSTDGGKTWKHIENEVMQRNCPTCGGENDDNRSCKAIAINPSDPNIVYVGTTAPDEEDFFKLGAIYKTEDGGSTWNKLALNPDPNDTMYIVDLAINPNAPDIVWALTHGAIYRSEDGGNNWIWKDLYMSILTGYDIEIKPTNPNEIFLASLMGIFKIWYIQNLNELEWDLIKPDFEDVRDLAFAPQNPEILYAAWRNFSSDNLARIARSTDGGINWEEPYIVNYQLHPLQFLTLAVHPKDSEVIFGGDFSMGLFKSTDHGQTWNPINVGINAVTIFDFDINPNNRSHILAATSAGIYEKKEGDEWALISNFPYTASYTVSFHPTISQTYYAGRIDGYIAKTIDGGVNWTFSNPLGDTQNYVTDIAVHPSAPNVVFISVFGYYGSYGEIYKSKDGGNNFERSLECKYTFNTLAIDPSDPNHIFAGGGNFSGPEINGDLWESTNGGIKWDRAGLQEVVVNSLLINPNDPNIIYAGCGHDSGTNIPLYISKDGGKNFEPSFSGMRKKSIPLYGIWGDNPNNIFIIGEYGDILHYDGTLSPMISNTSKTLLDIWGSSSSDIFAVGMEGTILHYNGTWTDMDSAVIEHLCSVYGTSPNNVFVVGFNGTILHYDGTWSVMDSNTTEDLYGVWGTAPNNVFAVGSNGTILHYDTIWSVMDSNTTEDLYGVWGTAPNNVFAVGSNGTILYYDGKWSAMDSNIVVSLSDIWGSSSNDIFAVGSDNMILHYDGNLWAEMDSNSQGEALLDIWGFSGTNIFVTGSKGSIFNYNGTLWTNFKKWEISGNSVIDLEYHPENKNIVYAATPTTGIYISPNQGSNWLDLGKPDYYVFAIVTSSLYAGTEGGLWQCTGTGVITGQIKDNITQSAINQALVYNDWVKTISINGEYLMVSPSGLCNVTASAESYRNKTEEDVIVYGGNISWVNFYMEKDPDFTIDPNINRGKGNNRKINCFIASVIQIL